MQNDIRFIYESLWLNKKYKKKEAEFKKNEEKKEKIIKLDPSFWEKINEKALEKSLQFFQEGQNLLDIHPDEEQAINILKVFYKYKNPQSDENGDLKIVPNQKGKLCEYKKLYREKDINRNFKIMLKTYFSYDLSNLLVHEKLEKVIQKELTINENIITKVKNSFYDELNENKENNYKDQYSKYLEKSKQLIHFYPKNENEKTENLVKKFIKLYKVLSGEDIKEEEINTMNSTLWEKAIKILIIDLLEKLNKDKNFSGTFKRLNIKEDKEEDIINNLNDFYFILFHYLIYNNEKEIINDFEFIPNERKEYKHLDYVFHNKNIINDIKNIYSHLVKDNKYTKILILEKIELSISHKEKVLRDIAIDIDREIKNKFTKIDALIEIQSKEIYIEENFKIACKKLITQWFASHKDDRKKFEFVNSHIPEIANKIIYEGKFKDNLDDFYINSSPDKFSSLFNNIHRNNNNVNNNLNNERVDNFEPNYTRSYNQNNYKHNLYSHSYYNDESFDFNDREIEFLNSSNSTRNISIFTKNENNIINNNIHQISESLKKYYLAQAYVYEDLTKSNLFEQIDWKNRVSDDEEGEEVSLLNENKYKIKEPRFPFDITITSKNKKDSNIFVQVINEKRFNYIKFKCKINQWELFNNKEKEPITSILALVKFQYDNTPEIYYIKKCDLNELI